MREPLLVLDRDLRVIVASRSFYVAFQMSRERTQGHTIYDLDDGVWNIPELRLLLEKIVPEHGVMEGFQVERDFPRLGRRSMLLNARQVFYEGNGHTTIQLGLEDVTERRRTERAVQKLLEQKEMLLQEMSHRVANSLQIIASILLMKAKIVDSPETRLHLQDAHRRVMSIASVQQHLQASGRDEQIVVVQTSKGPTSATPISPGLTSTAPIFRGKDLAHHFRKCDHTDVKGLDQPLKSGNWMRPRRHQAIAWPGADWHTEQIRVSCLGALREA